MIQDIEPAVFNSAYLPTSKPIGKDLVFCVRGQELLCKRCGEAPSARTFCVPRVDELGVGPRALTYLFSLDDVACWLLDPHALKSRVRGYAFVSNRDLRIEGCGPKSMMFAAYTAIHVAHWYRTNRYCGSCGAPLSPDPLMRALRCPACENVVFPRLNPAVIACVCDPERERIVLTRYAQGRYRSIDALVAGFVEIGETLEQCVEREVREELGLRVRNIRYYKSQPWGVAGDILAGFWCDVDGDPTLHIDKAELGRAVWAAPGEIVGQPDDLSLTNEMMCRWRDERLGTGTVSCT